MSAPPSPDDMLAHYARRRADPADVETHVGKRRVVEPVQLDSDADD